jgi:hypothetical protein
MEAALLKGWGVAASDGEAGEGLVAWQGVCVTTRVVKLREQGSNAKGRRSEASM